VGYPGICVAFITWPYIQRGKTPGNTYIFIRKYQEIPKNFRKFLEISGNTCKFQEISGNTTKYEEIQDQKHEILGNTRLFIRKIVIVGGPDFLSSRLVLGRSPRHRFLVMPNAVPVTSLRGDSALYRGIRL
jgi:hypothetical protein